MAVATNCSVIPIGNVGPSGPTEIEVIVGATTVTIVDCDTPPSVAEIVVEPAATAVTSPVALTEAATGEDEAQVTRVVISALLPSL
jgi:hypothetical protein